MEIASPITVAMKVQGDVAASTPGGLWRMNFEEGITHFLEKRVNLTDVFKNVGAITAGQVVNIAVLCLLTVLFPICLDISLITPACCIVFNLLTARSLVA
jgi:hypothetical protein